MRVLFLSFSDYAQAGYLMAECLKKVGVSALSMGIRAGVRRHPLERSVKILDTEQFKDAITSANVVVWMHSIYTQPPEGVEIKGLHVVFHGGSGYRNGYNLINKRFNKFVGCSLVQTELGLGAKNEHWLIPPVDTDGLQPDDYTVGKKLIIGHFPTNSRKKATNLIKVAISVLEQDEATCNKFEFHCSGLTDWRLHMTRVSKCDVYVDSLRFGLWGMSTLEAAALGKVVVGGFKLYPQYLKEYGESPFVQVKEEDTEGLVTVLKRLILQDKEETANLKEAHRKWVEDLHSFTVTGEKLQGILNAYR